MKENRMYTKSRKGSELLDALRDRNEELALQMIGEGIVVRDRAGARDMLELALDCSAELFDRLLAICPEGDYALLKWIPLNWTGAVDTKERNWQNNDTNVQSKIIAPIITIAAAMNKPDHIRVLLDRGFSPNGNSQDSLLAMIQEKKRNNYAVHSEEPYVEFYRLQYSNEQGYLGITPLAAALLYANPACVQVLLERKETAKLENGAVAVMFMLPDREENLAYQEARRLILSQEEGHVKMPLSETPECRWRVRHNYEHAFRRCTFEQMREELDRCDYDANDIMAITEGIAEAILPEFDRDQIKKLLYLVDRYPFILEDVPLRHLLATVAANNEVTELLDRCIRKDETIKTDNRMVWHYWNEKTIKYLSQYARIEVDRWAMSPIENEQTLWALLRNTTISPGNGRDLSPFARAVIDADSTPLLQWVLENGYFESEPLFDAIDHVENADWMLNYHVGISTRNRRLLQDYLEKNMALVPPKRDFADIDERMRMLLTQDLEEDEESEILSDWSQRGKMLSVMMDDTELVCGYAKPLLAAFGKTRALMNIMKDRPVQRHGSDHMTINGDRNLKVEGTVLCFAAMFGRISLMERLLEQCADPDELGCGGSSFYLVRRKRLPMTPLMGAILRQQWDAAEFLFSRGAKLDLDSWAVKEFMKCVDKETKEELFSQLGKYLSRTKGER